MPFLMTGFEGGMLGYALFGLLYGAGQTHVFAMADIGQTVFAYTVFLSVLNVVNGDKPSVKGVVKNMLSNPACVGMLLGIVLGALGLGKAVAASPVGALVTEVISFNYRAYLGADSAHCGLRALLQPGDHEARAYHSGAPLCGDVRAVLRMRAGHICHRAV